jgi:hypothetical protein
VPSTAPLSLQQIDELEKHGAKLGVPNVIDYGDQSVLTSFGDQPGARALGAGLKKSGEDIARSAAGVPKSPLWMHEPLPQPERVKLDSEVIDYEKSFARPEGTGAATHQLMRELRNKDAPALFAKLDQDPAIRAKILERMEMDAALAAQTGQPVREDLQRAREILSREGLTGLLRALRAGVALPAAALVPLSAALREKQGLVE